MSELLQKWANWAALAMAVTSVIVLAMLAETTDQKERLEKEVDALQRTLDFAQRELKADGASMNECTTQLQKCKLWRDALADEGVECKVVMQQ